MTSLETLLKSFRTASASEREKGTYFEELILCYLRNEATYRDLYSDVWTYSDWAKLQGLDGRDTGIDLVAKTSGTGQTKQVIARDMSQSATLLCARVKQLLNGWGVPGVDSVYFDESVSDIEINQRKRTSYGKGKRGIFLTAYMISLMERAIGSDLPHLGLAVIDSPVVTYKDPKHAVSKDDDELLDEGVKDRFYAWLADRAEDGQIIILENEEPNVSVKAKLKLTEFVGHEIPKGRPGFFPA